MSLKEQVRELVIRVAKIDASVAAQPDFFARPLPIDSMLAIEIMAHLEKRFQIEIPEEDLFKFDKLSSIVEIVEGLVDAGTVPAEAAVEA